MTSDLKKLLNDSAAHAPAERHSVSEIVRSAQRNHRSHTAKLMGGSVLALALVAGVGYAAMVNSGRDDAEPVHTEPDRIVVDAKDARKAVEGKDYESIAVIDHAPDSYAVKWTPDDLVPVVKGKGQNTWDVLDGADGEGVADLQAPAGEAVLLSLGQGVAVWWVQSDDGLAVLQVQDLVTGEWAEVPVEFEGLGRVGDTEFLGVADGRLFVKFEMAPDVQVKKFAVVSAPLDGSAGFQREVDGTVASAVLSSASLAWVSGLDEPVRVRSLSTGEFQVFEDTPGSRKGCFVRVLGLSPERIATSFMCDGTQPEGASETHVWSLNGGPTVVLANGRPP